MNFPATTRGGGLQWLCGTALSTPFRRGFLWKGRRVTNYTGPLRSSGSKIIVSSLAEHSQLESQQSVVWKSVKKKVAMWVGYVGTHYKGLQIQRSTAPGQTIEQELETAVFRAGGILESNFGALEKIGWMRSSRTDKGVHSLSTVISFKMEVDLESWGSDGDGIQTADRINQHLPDTIRIFGIIPVNKSFDPRKACFSRTYHYLLPATTLGITRDARPNEVQQCLDKLQTILSMFEGRCPYHNYTVRSQYRQTVHSKRNKKKARGMHGAMREGVEDLLPFELELSSDEDEYQESEDVDDLEAPLLPVSTSQQEVLFVPPKIRWLHELDVADKIYTAHFRTIHSFTCGSLQTCRGFHFIKLSIHGESFMLHQIRKMVGTVIAVMRDVIASDVIPISLTRPCRVVLPLAPPEGLLLASNEFFPFRTTFLHGKTPGNLPRLNMSSKVLERKEKFWSEVLLPHMAALMEDKNEDWSYWLELLQGARLCKNELDGVRRAWREWGLQVSERRAAKRLRLDGASDDGYVDQEAENAGGMNFM